MNILRAATRGRPYIDNARFACSNFIRLGGDVRKTCSALVERYSPSSQKISGATLIFGNPIFD